MFSTTLYFWKCSSFLVGVFINLEKNRASFNYILVKILHLYTMYFPVRFPHSRHIVKKQFVFLSAVGLNTPRVSFYRFLIIFTLQDNKTGRNKSSNSENLLYVPAQLPRWQRLYTSF